MAHQRFLLPTLFFVGSVLSASADILKTFDVVPNKVYELVVSNRALKADASLRLIFLDESGVDVAEREMELGFECSGGILDLNRSGGGGSIISRSGHRFVRASKAIVEVDAAVVDAVTCCDLRHVVDLAESRSSGVDWSAHGTGRFSANLLRNGTFESMECGQVLGWKPSVLTNVTLSKESYSGVRSLRMSTDSDGGSVVSDPFAVDRKQPLSYSYALKYSRYANPHGHPNPVRVRFLKKDESGRFATVGFDATEFLRFKYSRFRGQWAIIRPKPISVPCNASHAQIVVEHRDVVKIWSGKSVANWGEILVDDIAVWQGSGLPPQMPIGLRRENSIEATQQAVCNGGMFFTNSSDRPQLDLRIENLLGYDRRLSLFGEVMDEKGEGVLSSFRAKIELAPFECTKACFEMPMPKRFGVYPARFRIADQKCEVMSGEGSFAWAAHPSGATEADRGCDSYLFDMHPGKFNFGKVFDADAIEFEARMMKLIGVRGVRLQTEGTLFSGGKPSFSGLTISDVKRCVARVVDDWRSRELPILRKYGIQCWCSLMEQSSKNPFGKVISAEDEDKLKVSMRTFAQKVGTDVEFVLYGNEGLGGYTAHLGDDDDLFERSAFSGTTRSWFRTARMAIDGLKEGNSEILVGLSHASDPKGLIAERYMKIREGGFPLDCWGSNSYVKPAMIMRSIANEIGPRRVKSMFAVIPELGEHVNEPKNAYRASGEMLAHYLRVSAEAPWVRRIAWFIFSYLDTFAMFDSQSNAPRATALAYLVMTDRLRSGHSEMRERLTKGECFRWRRRDGSSVLIAWSAAGDDIKLAIPKGAELVTTDVFGNTEVVNASDGVATVQLSDMPRYFEVSSGDLEWARGFNVVDRDKIKRDNLICQMDRARDIGKSNLIQNSDFVSRESNVSGWLFERCVGFGGIELEDCRFECFSGGGFNGHGSVLVDNRVKDKRKSGAHPVVSQTIEIHEGMRYGFCVHVKQIRSGNWIQPQVDLLNADGSVLRSLPCPENDDDESEWVSRYVGFIAAPRERWARILLKANDGGAGAAFFSNPELRELGAECGCEE